MGALRSRRYSRRAAGALARGCAISLAILFGGAGVVFADPSSTTTVPTTTAPTTAALPAFKALPPVIAAPAPAADQATLALEPTHSGAGAQVKATVTGFDYCLDAPHLLWDGQALSASLTFTVPDAPAGAHRVTAVCRLLDGARTVAPATFTVDATEKPTLTLDPGKGSAGSQVTATPKGFGTCLEAPHLEWDDQPLAAKAVDPAIGSLAFTVPDGPAAAHTVTAVCETLRKASVVASAPFTVVETPKPTLTLSTPKGPAGSEFTATGTGFACPDSGSVLLFWDGDRSPATKASSGLFRVPFTVPATASAGEYTVLAACAGDPDVAASQQFTVVSPVTNQGTPAASISLDPTQGHGGDAVRVVGWQFNCANQERTVALSWDGAPPRFNVAVDGLGEFTTWFAVPTDAAVGSHTVRASCADGSAWDTGEFTIVTLGLPVPPPITTPPVSPPPIIPPPPHKWWPVVVVSGVIAVLLLAAAVHFGRRALRPPGVRVITRPRGPAVVRLRERPAAGEMTYAIQVAVHSQPDVVSLRGVDDEHIRVE